MIKQKPKIHANGFTHLEFLVSLVLVFLIGAIGWRVVERNHVNSTNKVNATSSTSPSQVNCTTTKTVYFPDKDLSLKMPSCWGIQGDTIVSSNEISVPNDICDSLANGNANSCPTTVNQPDATLYVSDQSASGNTLQQWIAAKIRSLPHPDPQMYTLTTFASQPAECSNPNDPTHLGVKYYVPPQLPPTIPVGVFINECDVVWNNKVYTIGPIEQNTEYQDIQQVYSLLESIKFQ
jgi:hypothetical protein